MRAAARPSPYGLAALAIARYSRGSISSRRVSSTIRARSTPTRRATPAAMPSGRAVRSRPLVGPSAISAAQAGQPGGKALGPLGALAQHQDRLGESGRLLLDPAAVAQHEPRPPQPAHQLAIVEGLVKLEVRESAEDLRR